MVRMWSQRLGAVVQMSYVCVSEEGRGKKYGSGSSKGIAKMAQSTSL